LTVEALDFALAAVPGAHRDAREALLDAYRTLDCYAEVPLVLSALKAQDIVWRSSQTAPRKCFAMRCALPASRTCWTMSSLPTRFRSSRPPASLCAGHEPAWRKAGRGVLSVIEPLGYRWGNGIRFRCNWINRTGQPDEYCDLPPVKVLADLTGLL